MIEGEEIFQSASETAYRLCNSDQETDTAVFSASWDKNDHNRLFVCSQNGQLRVMYADQRMDTLKYDVLFRRYTSYDAASKEPEKLITQHWDKFVTIPDRPNEIIFLLGLTKSLYYTAIPGGESTSSMKANFPKETEAVIASDTRAAFPGYLYGTPIMEISGHHARITSLAVSPAGHVLASGDERGNVRLLLLQLLDQLSIIKKREQRRRKHVIERQFNEFLPSYNINKQSHSHSVFSLEWLPVYQTKDDVRYYGLVTGSADSAVRIWTISCCSKTGLSMTPCQSLNTMSTQVLCLSSYLLVDKQQEIQIARKIASAKLQAAADEQRDPFLGRSYKSPSVAREEEEINGAKSVYISAGTHVGTIYVWKLNYNNIQKALLAAVGVSSAITPVDGDEYDELIESRSVSSAVTSHNTFTNRMIVQPSPAPVTNANKYTDFAIDDGTALHSLLQTSDKPIIHVSITSNGSQNLTSLDLLVSNKTVDISTLNSSSNIVLAASDTVGSVRFHTVDRTAATNVQSEDFELNLSKNEQAMQASAVKVINKIKATLQSRSGSHLDKQISSLGGIHSGAVTNFESGLVNNNQPLVLSGEESFYPCPVLACAFQAMSIFNADISANNSGSNTPISSSPYYNKYNPDSRSTSPSGSVSGRMSPGGLLHSNGIHSLRLTRAPQLLVALANGRIIFYPSENAQNILGGTAVGGADNVELNFLTAVSSTTESSPSSSEHSVPQITLRTRANSRDNMSHASVNVSQRSSVSPIGRGGRGNALFASPDPNGPVRFEKTLNNNSNKSNKSREMDSEIVPRPVPLPMKQQQSSVPPQKSAKQQQGTTSTPLVQTTSRNSSGANPVASNVRSQTRQSPLNNVAPNGATEDSPVVHNVGGGVTIKSNLQQTRSVQQTQTQNVVRNNITNQKSDKEDDSLPFPSRVVPKPTAASSIATLKSARQSTALKSTPQAAHNEDDSSVEPRSRLPPQLYRETESSRQRVASRPKIVLPKETTLDGGVATSQSASHQKGGSDYRYEKMSTHYANDYAMATLNSTKILHNNLHQLQDDEITVSTIATTQSDLRHAAKIATRSQALNDNRYAALVSANSVTTAVGGASGEMKGGSGKSLSRIAKQTDPSYLARKMYGGPTDDDLKVLRVPDPLVSRSLSFTPNGGGGNNNTRINGNGKGGRNVWESVESDNRSTATQGGGQKDVYKYNSEFGLYCDMDKNTLQSTFRMEVNADEILGRMDMLQSAQIYEEAVETYRLNYLLDLTCA